MQTSDRIWQSALGELEMQFTKATFNTWVKPVKPVSWDQDTFVLGTPNSYIKDWLENRLHVPIQRTLSGIVGEPIDVQFIVWPQEQSLGPSDNLVTPVVGWWDDPRDVTVGDPREVARVARVPLADLVDPANRFRVRHPSGYVGPAFGVAGMVVWGFTGALLDAVLEAAGLARPWDLRDVRELPVLGVRRPQLPGTFEPAGEEDAAAPTVADPAPDGPAARTVPPR